MKSRTKISWADFTINPWEGCTKVSAGCKFCYAETRNQRYAAGANWGPGAPRRKGIHAIQEIATLNRRFGPEGDLTLMEDVKTLERWIEEKEAPPFPECIYEFKNPFGPGIIYMDPEPGYEITKNTPHRQARIVTPQIFSLSLGDVLDPEVDPAWLAEFMAAIAAAPNLQFLLLTKRPELFWKRMALAEAAAKATKWHAAVAAIIDAGLGYHPNLAWGTSVEDEKNSPRILWLAEIPAAARFVSCEPLIDNPNLWKMLDQIEAGKINLVISGGESGAQARPMHPGWIEAIQKDCQLAGIPHHFKQWGSWAPAGLVPLDDNQRNPGNRQWLSIDGHVDLPQDEFDPRFPYVAMHRTPGKMAVKPTINGAIQQPRLIFPKP